MFRAALLGTAAVALCGVVVASMAGCEGTCEEKLSCAYFDASAAGSGGHAGHGGGSANGGSAGSTSNVGGAGGGSTCGDGEVTPGELCFADLKTYSAGGDGARDIALLDCDNDGDLDVAAATETGVAVLRNVDGALVDLVSNWGSAFSPIAIDTDGVNLAVAHSADPGKTMYPLAADPGQHCYFQAGLFQGGAEAYDVAITAIDSDNEPDHAWIMANGGQQLLHWNASAGTSGSAPTPGARALTIAQIFDDATAEIVVAHAAANGYQPFVTVHAVSNSVVGQGLSFPSVPLSDDPKAVAAGDINGDGLNDVVVANDSALTAQVLLNNGTTLTLALSDIDLGGAGTDSVTSLDLADLDADGDLDIVVLTGSANAPSRVSVFVNSGTGDFTPAAEPFPLSVPMNASAVKIADMNGDGAIDIVVSSTTSAAALSIVLAVP